MIDLLGVCCILSAFFITTLRLYEKETFESCFCSTSRHILSFNFSNTILSTVYRTQIPDSPPAEPTST